MGQSDGIETNEVSSFTAKRDLQVKMCFMMGFHLRVDGRQARMYADVKDVSRMCQ